MAAVGRCGLWRGWLISRDSEDFGFRFAVSVGCPEAIRFLRSHKVLLVESARHKLSPVNPSQMLLRRTRTTSNRQWQTVFWTLSILATVSLRASGPVALWRGEGNANDSAGTNHGTLVNGTGFAVGMVPGEGGQSFSFDGINDEMQFGHSLDFNFTNGVTIAGWLKTLGTGDFSGLVDKFGQAGQVTGVQVGTSGNNGFPPNQSGILRSDLGTGSSYVTAFNFRPVFDGLPHHFAVTCDTKQAMLYVDGVAGPPVVATNWVANNVGNIVVGHDSDSGGRYFSGQLDEVAIYARALSAAEVQGLAGRPPLQIVRTAPGQATVSWPQTASGFRLQTNNTLAPGGWGDAGTGTNNPVIVPVSLPMRSYRLVKP